MGDPSDPLSLNRYVYCGLDPVNFVDPTGFLPVPAWKMVIGALNTRGYQLTAACLSHSLQKNPGTLSFGQNSIATKEILKSSDWANTVKSLIANAGSNTSFSSNGSMAFNSGDLFLSLHNVNYSVSGTLSKGVWNLDVSITDTFDFDKNAKFSNPIANYANQEAAKDQTNGTINTYDISIDYNQSVPQ